MNDNLPDSRVPVYRIGAVSRLTGIETVTLRMWERRYAVVSPGRSEGRNRLYNREDINRLVLIKRLVDAGHAISTVANLALADLQARLQFRKDVPHTTCRVAVIGDTLPPQIAAGHADLSGLDIVALYRDRHQFEQQAQLPSMDVLVLECPTVQERTVVEVTGLLNRSGARRAVVVYGFGRQRALQQLDSAHILTLRTPIGLAELVRACLSESVAAVRRVVLASVAVPAVAPPQRYSSAVLGQLIAQSAAVLHCECPRHLADLLLGLNAFERYSTECENLTAERAAVHAYLRDATARARAMLEEALARLLEVEGNELPTTLSVT